MNHFPRRTTAPTVEPVTLARAKLHLRVDHADEDDLITDLITTARQAAEDRTEHTLMPSTWTLRLPTFPTADSGSIELLRPPIVGVTSVQYLDASGALQTVNPSAYLVDTQSEPGRLVPLAGSWPATAVHPQAVTIVYTAGYPSAEAVPAPIKQWMLLAIGDMFETRNLSAERPQVVQGFADGLLDPYRIYSL